MNQHNFKTPSNKSDHILFLSTALFTILIVCFGAAKAQQNSASLQLSNVKASFLSDGYLFSRISGSFESGMEIPLNSGKHTIYTAGIWLAGIDSAESEIVCSAQNYPSGFKGIFAGPIQNSPFNDNSKNGIYSINQSAVQNHINNFGSPGYVIPGSILNWIGNGNSASGMQDKLAPFVDLDADAIYEPITEGEYPYAPGGKNLFFLNNDLSGVRTGFLNGIRPTGIQIETYAYSLEEDYDVFENCVFLNVVITNLSENTYNNFYTGFWFDFDIGGSSDDFVGCDSSINLFYGYNSNNFDLDYANNAPTQAVMLLNKNLNSFVSYNSSSNSVTGEPQDVLDIYNFLTGKWKDGSSITTSGNGTGGVGNNTNFLYNNPVNQESGTGSDKRALGSVGPIDLRPGESQCFDLVVFPSYDQISGTTQSNYVTVLQKADTIRKAFLSYAQGCNSPYIVNDLSDEKFSKSNPIQLFPNPATNQIHLNQKEIKEGIRIQILDINGKVLEEINPTPNQEIITIGLKNLPNGLYLIKYYTNTYCHESKFIIQK